MSVLRRLVRLEARGMPRSPGWGRESQRRDVIDRASAWFGGWHVLRQTMVARHVDHVESVVIDVCWGYVCRRQGEIVSPSFGVPFELIDADALVQAVDVAIRCARPGSYIPWRGPYSLPETLADLYQERGYVSSNDDCESCGFHVPAGWFERCPLCGGTIGCLKYHKAHDTYPPTFTIPEQVIDAYRSDIAAHVDRLFVEADAINTRESRVVGT